MLRDVSLDVLQASMDYWNTTVSSEPTCSSGMAQVLRDEAHGESPTDKPDGGPLNSVEDSIPKLSEWHIRSQRGNPRDGAERDRPAIRRNRRVLGGSSSSSTLR